MPFFLEAWVQAVVPSSSQVTEESLRSDVEPKSQTTIISSVPLPGSVIDHPDEMQANSLYVAKSSATDAESGHGKHSANKANRDHRSVLASPLSFTFFFIFLCFPSSII